MTSSTVSLLSPRRCISNSACSVNMYLSIFFFHLGTPKSMASSNRFSSLPLGYNADKAFASRRKYGPPVLLCLDERAQGVGLTTRLEEHGRVYPVQRCGRCIHLAEIFSTDLPSPSPTLPLLMTGDQSSVFRLPLQSSSDSYLFLNDRGLMTGDRSSVLCLPSAIAIVLRLLPVFE